jgi:hypothetical protein
VPVQTARGDASDLAPLLLVDVGSQVSDRARAVVSHPRAARPLRCALVPPANGVRGGANPDARRQGNHPHPDPSGGAILLRTVNEAEVALARW